MFTYTIKGISGGYNGYFQLNPFYMNLGIYNNSESRDLWEYEVPLTKIELKYLILHLWEVSLNTGFPYYFLDENCSFYVLQLIEAVKPNWILTKTLPLFVAPVDTLKKVTEKIDTTKVNFYPSIKRKLNWKLSQLTHKQYVNFNDAKKNIKKLEKIDNVRVLESLMDYWKYSNYKKHTKLNKIEKALMDTTFSLRAKNSTSGFYKQEKVLNWKSKTNDAPDLGHSSHRIKVDYEKYENISAINITSSVGFHHIDDYSFGFEDYSFIDFLTIRSRYVLESKSFLLKNLN